MNVYLAVGAVCVIAWGVLVYGFALGPGWVHVLLALGCVLVARGLVIPRRR
jgi:hypothetical protein